MRDVGTHMFVLRDLKLDECAIVLILERLKRKHTYHLVQNNWI
jgi:hypothetical protein